jgi:hypothetical protein
MVADVVACPEHPELGAAGGGATMEVQSKPPTMKGPSDWFTGDVHVDPIAQGRSSDPMSVASVHFCPCGHTAWHRHTIGQTLCVTEALPHRRRRLRSITGWSTDHHPARRRDPHRGR